MGVGLSRVSSSCLPQPSPGLKSVLEERGVKMGEVQEQMMRVELPSGWGLYCVHDRGDIWSGFLLDDKGTQVGNISWMSKGSYDNQASMHSVAPSHAKTLDLTRFSLKNGFFVSEPCDEEAFVNKLNSYYEAQFRGAYQRELDSTYASLKEEADSKGYTYSFEKLKAQEGAERTLTGPMMAMTTNFTKRFSYAPSSPSSVWVSR